MNASEIKTYDRVATEINAPVYAYYADRIVEKTGITRGKCLDVGCGGGYLGLALSERTELEFLFMDRSTEMLECARKNITERGISGRAGIIQAEVQQIPLADCSVDLVVSRGSVPFWDELPVAFAEIMRVLRPGGCAYVGGGLGPVELRESLQAELKSRFPEWGSKKREIPRHDDSHYRNALLAAGITDFSVTRSDTGMWIEFRRA